MSSKLDAMIIGVEKAGTSALLKHLGKHPDIAVPGKYVSRQTDYGFGQEFSYFLPDSQLRFLDFESYFKSEFGNVPSDVKLFLAKNVGVCYEPKAMEAFKKHNDAAKVIIVLRNPVDRAFSSFWYQRYRGAEKNTNFLDAVRLELESSNVSRHLSYLRKGLYSEQILSARTVFGDSNVVVLLSEKMKTDAEGELAKAFSLIGVPALQEATMDRVNESKSARLNFLSSYLYKESSLKVLARKIFSYETRKNLSLFVSRLNSKSGSNPLMAAAEREMLTTFYAEDVAELSRMLNLDLKVYWKDFQGGERG